MARDTFKIARRLEKSMSSHIRRNENGSSTFFDAYAAAQALRRKSHAAADLVAKGRSVSHTPRQQ